MVNALLTHMVVGAMTDPKGDPVAQSAHVPHILRIEGFVVWRITLVLDVVMTVFHAMNHRTGPQKQERLEARVRHEMEHRRCIGPDANRRDHITELAYGAVRHSDHQCGDARQDQDLDRIKT